MLKIKRISKSKYLIKDGKKVIRFCTSFKEARDVILSKDLLEEECLTEEETLEKELEEFYQEAA